MVKRERDRALFFRRFLRESHRVAAVTPASRWLARAHTGKVTPDQPQTIVELGCGTGVVTEAILKRAHPESVVVALDIDPAFVEVTQARCPRAIVAKADAGQIGDVLDSNGLGKIDLTVSCLSLTSLNQSAVKSILDTHHERGPDSWFTQQTLMPLLYRWMYKRLFHEVILRPEPRNLPPGGVYHCRRVKMEDRWFPGKASS